MSGWLNIACRFNDGTIQVTDAHSRNAHDLYAKDLSFLSGDDSGARSYLDWQLSLGSDLSNVPLRENEYGVLAVDFMTKTILFNRDDWDLTRSDYFNWHSTHDKDMAHAGRVQLVCPDNSFPPAPITPDLEARWDSLVHPWNSYTHEGLKSVPFPARFYVRVPTPYFQYDYSPWTVKQFNETDETTAFFDALEASGFTVDRTGWLADFEDD